MIENKNFFIYVIKLNVRKIIIIKLHKSYYESM